MTKHSRKFEARERARADMSYYGMSVFDGQWYTGSMEQLDRVGVARVVNPLEDDPYNNTVNDFAAGDRVELSPACDLWMRGAKFGVVRGIKNERVVVRMDNRHVRKLQHFAPDYLRKA